MSKSAPLRPTKGKPAEVQGPLTIPEQVPAPLTVPEQVQTPQTILESASARPERRGRSSAARRYRSLIGFPLWLLFLAVALTSFIYLLHSYSAKFFTTNTGREVLFFAFISGIFFLIFFSLLPFIALLILSLFVIDGYKKNILRQWRFGYDAATDSFFRDSGFIWGSLRREISLPAADFVGLYIEKCGVDCVQLWLASGSSQVDAQLAEMKLWYPSNERFAQQLAEELGAAGGLKLINRLPRS